MRISISVLLSTLLVLLIYSSNPPWFIWEINQYLILSSVLAILIVVFYTNKSTSQTFFYSLPSLIAAVSFFFVFKGIEEIRISTVLFFTMYVVLFFISDIYKIKAFNLFTISLAIILSFSLSFWFVHNFIFSFPFAMPLAYAEGMGKGNINFDNFLFFIQPQLDYFRFYGIFDEPGTLGLLCTVILFVRNYDFKDKYNIIILIGGLFTFSLAFYLLTLLGFISISIIEKRYKGIFFSVSLGFVLLPVFYSIDAFRLSIFSRFSDIGKSFSERTNVSLDQFYDHFVSTNSFYYGKSLLFFKENPGTAIGQSYKIFMIEYGVIGLLLLISLYVFLIDYRRFNLYVLILSTIFIFSFLQRPFMFTPWQITLFSIALPVLYKRNRNESSFQNL